MKESDEDGGMREKEREVKVSWYAVSDGWRL